MESFEEIVDAAKCPFQSSSQVTKITGPTSSHTSKSDRINAVCKEEGVVGKRKARGLVTNHCQQCDQGAWILQFIIDKDI